MKQKTNCILALFLLFLGLGTLSLRAQQDPIYNQYMFNPLVVNPAYAGSRELISVVLLHRSQWVGFGDGAPNIQTVSIHAPFANRKVGLGLTISHDGVGPVNRTGIIGSYAYRLKLGQGKLALAVRTSAYNYVFDWAKLDYKDTNEPAMNSTRSSGWVPGFDFGIRYNTKKFYAGLTLLNLNNPRLKFLDTDTTTYSSSLATHLNFTAGKAFELNENVVLKPSLMLRAEAGTTVIADANFSVLYKNTLWLGLSVRSTKGLILIVEYDISDKFRAGYSYDIALSKIQTTNSGSHEIFVGFDFGKKHKPRLISPRIYF